MSQINPGELIDLAISRVVLFSSGVGYFEHAGVVAGDQRMRLHFTPDQIRDVLKSMVLTDEDGGRIDSVIYPAQEPIDKALESFDVDLSDDPDLSDLLKDLRGCEVVAHASEAIGGRLLSVEPIERMYAEPRFKQVDHDLVLMTGQGIRHVRLHDIDRLEIVDDKLQEEFNKALTLIAESRNRQRRPVDIRFSGDGERRVRVGYLVDTAIWKTSYRLDLSAPQPVLQGWAIVDNTSDHDWQGVQLSLVSGQPISFIQDLYTPLRAVRPEVKPRIAANVMPQVYEEALEMAAGGFGGVEEKARSAEVKMQKHALRKSVTISSPVADQRIELREESGVKSVAKGVAVGELFSFDIDHPVSLSRRSSAMLPIYSGPVEGKKLSIYNESVKATRPLNGVSLVNSTDLKLLGGPITVFDGGVYAGDAQIEHLPPRDKRLLSYAVDLEVTLDPSEKNQRVATAIKIAKGTLTVGTQITTTHAYTIKNKSSSDRILLIEHPFDKKRELIEPEGFDEKTSEYYRFRLSVAAGETTVFTVKTREAKTHGVSLTESPISGLEYYESDKRTDPELVQKITQAVRLRQKISDVESQIDPKEQAIRSIAEDQERINKNMKNVGADTALGKRYLAKLNTQEDKLEKLQAEVDTLAITLTEARDELADYLAGLTYDANG